jgi:phage terminase large subunit
MLFSAGPLYNENLKAIQTSDTVVNQGGTSSGKTYAILQVLFTIAIDEPGSIISVVGQDVPNLKKGALRDAETIVASSPLLQELIEQYHKTDRIYTLRNGSKIEFNAFQDFQDAKSGKRQYLFVNEGNGISWPIFQEQWIRTTKKTFIDYNPNAEFWVHQNIIGKPGSRLIISDHRHNPYVSEKLRAKIEGLKDIDYELWKVYARGLTGKLEGVIFKRYNIVDQIPADARFIGYGLDFGYSNDVTALVEVFLYGGELYVNELIYETGLLNKHILDEFKIIGVHKAREIIADGAAAKDIADIYEYGYNIKAATKGPGSIKNGIGILQPYVLNVTRRSTNLRKELNVYKWAQDKNGNLMNEPVDFMNHAIDALRYVALEKLNRPDRKGKYSIR